MSATDFVLGIDIGGSSIKAAPIDPACGRLKAGVRAISTPEPMSRRQLVAAIVELASEFGRPVAIGIGFPCTVQQGRVLTSDNLHPEVAGIDAEMLAQATGHPVAILNDAEAAARAEMRYGAGRGRTEKTLILTFGTGIGSSLAYEGAVIPCEFGLLPLHGGFAEQYAAAGARTREQLTWPVWAARVSEYLALVETVVQPELIILGGGVSAEHRQFFQHLKHRVELVPAALGNEAGIIGAAAQAMGLLSGAGCESTASSRSSSSRRLKGIRT
ncbi:ROK family protein [Lysobacter enzymogenes]|uniref:ROK family protein n=1 Tax=Lysobacter enzymogenes TaxID=69 RepID=UPI000897CE0F|nr:ROK family protein [Lysobacter enzymogenes]SDX03063.1 polyphosphate glucokinase [Lysobacter enzymogenes]